MVSAQFHDQLAKLGTPAPVWRILATLSDRENLSIGDLAAIVLLKQPTLSKILDRMIEQGLVSRTPSRDDRRRVHVAITATGRILVEDLLVRAQAHEAEALAGYAAADVDALKQLLRSLIDRLSEKT